MEGFEHFVAAEVGGYAGEVRRPVHPAGRELVGETDVIHIQAGFTAEQTRSGEFKYVLEDLLA